MTRLLSQSQGLAGDCQSAGPTRAAFRTSSLADIQVHRGTGHVELLKKNVRHVLVKVLPSMNEVNVPGQLAALDFQQQRPSCNLA